MDIKELLETLTKANAALDAQAQSQPEIDRLKTELDTKLDYIILLEANILTLKSDTSYLSSCLSDKDTEISHLRKERDDHGLEAMALREELDTLKANIDRALSAATEKFYDVMQSKPPASAPTPHTYVPVAQGAEMPGQPEMTSTDSVPFNDPEPYYPSDAWFEWNKARVIWNNYISDKSESYGTVHSNNTTLNYSIDL